MDFCEQVMASLDRLVESDAISKAIDAALAKCVQEVITSELRSYSDFGKRLTAAVQKSLAIHGDIDLPSYNHVILQIVRKQVETYTRATVQQQVAENLKELLAPAPESIRLSELCAAYLEQIKSHYDGGCHCGEQEIEVVLENTDYGYRDLYLSENRGKKKYERDINVCVNKEGQVFSLQFRNADVDKKMFAGPFYNFERMLFQLKAAKSTLIFDVDVSEIETSYGPDL